MGYQFFDRTILLLLYFGLAFALIVELTRFFGGEKINALITRYLGVMIRPHEKKNLTGATYILTSSILTILLFDKPIAIAAISYIVLGDTAGAIIGRLWGRVKFRQKSLEGSIGFFFASSIVAVIVPGISLWVKIAGALTATVVEALTLYVDDNLTVPILSGALMQLIVNYDVMMGHFS